MAVTRVELPTLVELRDRYINDVRRLKQRAGISRPNVAAGSESYVKGEAVSAAVLQVLARQALLQDAVMPDSAEYDDLVRLADVLRGMSPASGAGATGWVVAECTGTVTYAEGTELTSPDGLRYEVSTTTTATNGTWVPVAGVDTGATTDKPADTVMTWTAPPSSSGTTALVALGGLSGGVDADNADRLRTRLLDAIRHPAASGNWADYAQWAEESSAAVEKAFVYCGIQGPGTVHVAVAIEADGDTYYSREANASLLSIVNAAVVAHSPEHADVLVQSVDNETVNVSLRLVLPEHRADGGTGGGWVDPITYRWPTYVSTVSHLALAPTSTTVVRIHCVGSSPPVVDAHIAIWSSTLKVFRHAQIKSYSYVSPYIYDCTLYNPIDITGLYADDYVCPDAENLDKYAETVALSFAGLGPGEKTTSSSLLPRSYRRPLRKESWPHQWTSRDLGKLSISHPEIQHVSMIAPSLPSSPSTPGAVTSSPYILTLGAFGCYPYSNTLSL